VRDPGAQSARPRFRTCSRRMCPPSACHRRRGVLPAPSTCTTRCACDDVAGLGRGQSRSEVATATPRPPPICGLVLGDAAVGVGVACPVQTSGCGRGRHDQQVVELDAAAGDPVAVLWSARCANSMPLAGISVSAGQ
jgi:hypothetical protein